MDIHIDAVDVPAVITIEELRSAKLHPRILVPALGRAFPNGLDIAQLEKEGANFILGAPDIGHRGLNSLATYLYEKYKYRLPPVNLP